MSTETWKLEKDLCRCCHSEGLYKNLSEPCSNLGQEEIYSDMMRECFNIDLAPVPGMICTVTYTICDACVLRLRDAFNFKKQVLACELRFADIYSKNMIQVADSNVKIKVKEEVLDEMQDGVKAELSLDEDGTEDDLSDSFQIRLEEDEDSDDALDTIKKRSKIQKTKSKMTPKRMSQRKKLKEESKEATELAEEKKKGQQAVHIPYDDYLTITGNAGRLCFTCNVCSNRYKSRGCFTQHYKHVHLKQRPKLRSCHLCPVRVPGYLRANHMEKAHGLPAPRCNACGKKFAYPFLVLRHQKAYHMGEKTEECGVCGLKFATISLLKKHMPKHSELKPYKCEFCDKGFRWKKNLKTHVMIHLDERNHVCPVCDEAFVQVSSLNYHLAKRHPELI